MTLQSRRIRTAYLGRTHYTACWDLQQRLFDLRAAGDIPDFLLLTEHDPVYTIGRNGNDHHLLAGREELDAGGIELVHNDRGGDITYHGPGQLVGYPIIDLHAYYLDLHRYLRDLEECIIRLLATYGIAASRSHGYTGVWVEEEKICAIGIKTRNWTTMHGFALNVNPDLSRFERIIPCGIFDRGVTSMAEHMDTAAEVDELVPRVEDAWSSVFDCCVEHETVQQLLGRAGASLAGVPVVTGIAQ